MKYILVILALCWLASGCSSVGSLKDPEYEPSEAMVPEAKTTVDGAIYDPSSNLFLFEDVKARRVGDLITVVLEESINASKSASTEADKESDWFSRFRLDPIWFFRRIECRCYR